jgi:hypothetical protein
MLKIETSHYPGKHISFVGTDISAAYCVRTLLEHQIQSKHGGGYVELALPSHE